MKGNREGYRQGGVVHISEEVVDGTVHFPCWAFLRELAAATAFCAVF